MNSRIAIAGCGWLGMPLARALLADGYLIHGSTTSPDKLERMEREGVRPFLISLEENTIQGPVEEFLSDCKSLIIDIPPGLRSNPTGSYLRKMEQLKQAVSRSGIKTVLFISSTSVYGHAEGLVTEEYPAAPDTQSGREVLEAEALFRRENKWETTVVRFGGLIGPDRHPVTHLAGKKGLSNGSDPVNLIHREDCIHLIRNIFRDRLWGQVCNGVYPAHPQKQAYYFSEARERGLTPPEYRESAGKGSGKRVISTIFLAKNYSFYTSIFYGFTTKSTGFTTKK